MSKRNSGKNFKNNNKIGRKDEKIDVVYLWVDGSDPGFQKELKRNLNKESSFFKECDTNQQRYRDNGELRYSLRSLELYAPWVNNIYIVTNGQVPSWLDVTHKKIILVTHEQIFPDRSCLPTFNSCAIEMQLHRIPGLSRRFLYMNDDLFLGREIFREDFIIPGGGQHIYFEPNIITERFAQGPVHDRAYIYTGEIMDRLWRKNSAYFNSAAYYRRTRDKIFFRRPSWRRLPAHVPQLYDKEILSHIENQLLTEAKATSGHKFRSEKDLVIRLLYFFFLLESGEYKNKLEITLLDWVSEDFVFIMLKDSLLQALKGFSNILHHRPKFFCINDDLGEVAPDHPVLQCLRTFLASYFPEPSSFEKNP